MKGGKILNKLAASETPEKDISSLGNGKLRKATWQALSRDDSTDEKENRVKVLCIIEAAARFCGKGGEG